MGHLWPATSPSHSLTLLPDIPLSLSLSLFLSQPWCHRTTTSGCQAATHVGALGQGGPETSGPRSMRLESPAPENHTERGTKGCDNFCCSSISVRRSFYTLVVPWGFPGRGEPYPPLPPLVCWKMAEEEMLVGPATSNWNSSFVGRHPGMKPVPGYLSYHKLHNGI